MNIKLTVHHVNVNILTEITSVKGLKMKIRIKRKKKKKGCALKVTETYISSITGIIAFHKEFLDLLNQAAYNEYDHI